MLLWYAHEWQYISDSLLINQEALYILQPSIMEMSISLDLSNLEDTTVGQKLYEVLGEKIANYVSIDWLKGSRSP